jgi:carboxylesterase type B
LHHITAFGGKQDPLFRKVVMQSIASEILVDRRGEVESFYQEFLNASGCAGQTIACLRSAPFATLVAANQKVTSNVGPSAFKPGPAADGAWVRQMPALELASGNYFAGITSLLLSHVSNEGFVFVDGEIQTDPAFANLVNFIIPPYAPTLRTAVVNFYPSPNTPGSPYHTQNDRTIQYLDDTNFLCNLRYLNNVFQGKTWTMQYDIPPGFHSDDLTPTFYNGSGAATPTLDAIYKDYQSYLVSLSITGNPNTHRNTANNPATINWPHTTGQQQEQLSNVLNVGGTEFTLITDPEPLKSHCDFFLNVQAAVTLAGGYVPPGGAVANNLGITNPHPSANYTTHR